MIYEFAVEPEVMATWEHFDVLRHEFGASEGRFLVEYPGKWRRRVVELADELSSEIRAYTIKSWVTDADARAFRFVGAMARAWGDGDWAANAIRQQTDGRAFRAIVVRESPEARADVLIAGEFERNQPPWHVPRQDHRCPRQAEDMLACVRTLLEHSKELILVDRNFDPHELRFQKPFAAMSAIRSDWQRLEVHTVLPKTFEEEALADSWTRSLEPLMPASSTLSVFFWPGLPDGDKLHARLVLTERGGLKFDYGLDEGTGPAETTFVDLIEEAAWKDLREDYSAGGTRYGKPTVVVVSGRG